MKRYSTSCHVVMINKIQGFSSLQHDVCLTDMSFDKRSNTSLNSHNEDVFFLSLNDDVVKLKMIQNMSSRYFTTHREEREKPYWSRCGQHHEIEEDIILDVSG